MILWSTLTINPFVGVYDDSFSEVLEHLKKPRVNWSNICVKNLLNNFVNSKMYYNSFLACPFVTLGVYK